MSRSTVPSLLGALVLFAACGDDAGVGPASDAWGFETNEAVIGPGATVTVVLRNSGTDRFGPIRLLTDPVRDGAGLAQTGVAVLVDPAVVPTLGPGAGVTLTLSLHGADALGFDRYGTRLRARLGVVEVASIDLEVTGQSSPSSPVATLRLEAPEALRRGDVAALGVEAVDSSGAPVTSPAVRWAVQPADAGWITPDGRFVAYRDGPARILARAGSAVDSATIQVSPRTARMDFTLVGEGLETGRFTSDLWVRDGHAWTGSWGVRGGGSAALPGNRLLAWRLGPGGPVATDSLVVDARTTNDVKVSADGSLGVVTHEGSDDGRNGVTLFDLSDPAHPTVVGRVTDVGLESGVHNAWIDGNWLYLVLDGIGSGLRIMDVSDPAAPRRVSSYWAGESFLHDVIVRDGLAFLAHWDAGLVILDVGNGLAGGSPSAPVELGRLRELGGQTHNVWYWPERGLAFVGEEDFGTPGRMHVVDVAEPRAPREVATFAVPGSTPHNFWLDEEAEVLYLAWYDAGVRALDVSGTLLGELHRQGREMGSWVRAGETPVCWAGMGTCTWAPQWDDGLLYLADVNRGLVVLRPEIR